MDRRHGAQHALGTSSGMQPCVECAITTPMRNSALACLDHIHSFGSAALALGSGARLTGICKRDTTLAQASRYLAMARTGQCPTSHAFLALHYIRSMVRQARNTGAPTLVLAAASTSHEQPLLGRQARSPPGPSGRLVLT